MKLYFKSAIPLLSVSWQPQDNSVLYSCLRVAGHLGKCLSYSEGEVRLHQYIYILIIAAYGVVYAENINTNLCGGKRKLMVLCSSWQRVDVNIRWGELSFRSTVWQTNKKKPKTKQKTSKKKSEVLQVCYLA